VTDKVTVRGMDGTTRYLELPEGWDGTISITRADRALDDFIESMEVAYFAGKDVMGSAITETISGTVRRHLAVAI